ncbi:sterol-sensing domain of SREBP cleavage-activation-domain-containing protein [Phellopilus nigrolimitatus]|nr:sterol-sensing domain of SREBP cleavage-activation-domain-containing protein [Phellopilus nigrolimitatus]
MGGVLMWIRDRSSKFFHRFGIHCATHQIRLILISGLVITSLFYPALGIYSSSSSKLVTSFPTHILGQIFAPDVRALSFFENDLDSVWSGHDALRIIDDTVARARCGMEKTVRIERLLLTSDGFDSDTGAINHQMLLSALKLESRLTDLLSSSNFNCLSSHSRRCITLSPLEFWSHDEHILEMDEDLLRTVNTHRNISVDGLSLRAPMVFAGRESAEPHGSSIDFAAYLALTYFFHEDDCNGSSGHNTWLRALNNVASSQGPVSFKIQEPLLLALEFNPDMKNGQRVSLITLTLYLSYIIFFVYFSGSMRRMDTVHSRFGLCVTGLVEILSSTITSLSVCAIGGLRITLVPWGIFPIVIVFVGAENMFRLIDDVVKTAISLPVKERIGLGLSRAGTSNTLKVVTYNAILGVIAFFAQGAIRQFCVFAIVVLVAHWFLIHTFFVAVLSIDLQRLELDDLLRQNSFLAPSSSAVSVGEKQDMKMNRLSKFSRGIQKITRGRVAKNVSLLLLLAITATLYYSTLPSHKDEARSPSSRFSTLRSKAEQMKPGVHTEAREIWRVFSPDDDPLVHLRIEVPAIVTLDHQDGDMEAERRVHRTRWSARTLRPLWWIFKVMVLPIGATLSCLYILLLYLLKDADRLEGHRGHGEADAESASFPIEDRPSFKTLPRTFASDVGLLASNKDGSILASVSSDGEVFLWLAALRKYIQVDTTDLVLPSASSSSAQHFFSAIAVDDHGSYCAVGTCSGIIGIWAIQKDTVHPLAQHVLNEYASPVTQIELSASESRIRDRPIINRQTQLEVQDMSIPCVLAAYENGAIVQWLSGVPVPCKPTRNERVKASLIVPQNAAHPLACFFFDNGALEIIDNCRTPIIGEAIFIQPGTPEDHVVGAHACIVKIEDAPHVLVAAVTYSGIITFWDGTTGDCISTLDDSYGSVNNLRLLPIPAKACPQCGEVPLCSFSLVYSVGHVVFVDRGVLARRCSCPLSQPLVSKISAVKDSSVGRRSRSGSFVSSSGADAVLRPRSRHVSVSSDTAPDVSAFPVSAHGMHSRRGTEKDTTRRNSDKFADRPSFFAFEDGGVTVCDEDEHQRLTVPEIPRTTSSAPDAPVPSLWRNFRLVRVVEATCERGGWDILGNRILGLRRKPRKRQSPGDELSRQYEKGSRESALSSSVLDRWEVWIVDPAKLDGLLQASSLSTLRPTNYNADDDCSSKRRPIPRLSFTRLSPIVIRSSISLAGFGNTIGMLDFGHS